MSDREPEAADASRSRETASPAGPPLERPHGDRASGVDRPSAISHGGDAAPTDARSTDGALARQAEEADRTTGSGDWRAMFVRGGPRQWAVLALGVVMLGCGVAMVVDAGLGVSSWQLLEVGLTERFGLSFAVVVAAESVFALALGWLWLGERPGPATWFIAACAGAIVDGFRAVLPDPTTTAAQVVMLLVGTVLLGLALGLYLAADLGPSAQDAVFAGLMREKGMRPLWAKAAVDLTTGALGVALGATLGLGTIVLTFALPPIVERSLTLGHRLAGTEPIGSPTG